MSISMEFVRRPKSAPPRSPRLLPLCSLSSPPLSQKMSCDYFPMSSERVPTSPRKRSSSISSQASLGKLSERKRKNCSEKEAETAVELKNSVLWVSSALLAQRKSPFRSETVDGKTEPKIPATISVSIPPTFDHALPDTFLSTMSWKRQRGILMDTLRRLFIWSASYPDDQLKQILVGSEFLMDPFMECWCRIGTCLTIELSRQDDTSSVYGGLLAASDRVDVMIKACANRSDNIHGEESIKSLRRSDSYGERLSEDAGILDRLRNYIDDLYLLLNPFKKDIGHFQIPVQTPPPRTRAMLSPRIPGKTVKILNMEAFENELHGVSIGTESSAKQRVHWAPDTKTDERKSKRVRALPFVKEPLPTTLGNDGISSIQSLWEHLITLQPLQDLAKRDGERIVLRVSNNPDAFRTQQIETNLSEQCLPIDMDGPLSGRQTPSDTHQANAERRPSIVDALDILSEDFTKLSLNGSFSAADFATKFLTFVPKDHCSDRNETLTESKPSRRSKLFEPLAHLASMLALLTSMPDWTVYTSSAHKTLAKTALSLAYCCLLDQVLVHSCEFSKRLRTSIENRAKMEDLHSAIGLFYVCVEHLSNFGDGMRLDDKLYPFQADFQMVLEKLKNLHEQTKTLSAGSQHMKSGADEKKDPTSQGCKECREPLSADGSLEVSSLDRDCCKPKIPTIKPLYLACYLSSRQGAIEASTSGPMRETEAGLTPISVRGLFLESPGERAVHISRKASHNMSPTSLIKLTPLLRENEMEMTGASDEEASAPTQKFIRSVHGCEPAGLKQDDDMGGQ